LRKFENIALQRRTKGGVDEGGVSFPTIDAKGAPLSQAERFIGKDKRNVSR
jgi:hypothetical protein